MWKLHHGANAEDEERVRRREMVVYTSDWKVVASDKATGHRKQISNGEDLLILLWIHPHTPAFFRGVDTWHQAPTPAYSVHRSQN